MSVRGRAPDARGGHPGQDAPVGGRRVERAVGGAQDEARPAGLQHAAVGVEQERERARVVGLVGLEQRPVAPLVGAEAAWEHHGAEPHGRGRGERGHDERGVLAGDDVDPQPRAVVATDGGGHPGGEAGGRRQPVERAQARGQPGEVRLEVLRDAVHDQDRLVEPGGRVRPRHGPRAAPRGRARTRRRVRAGAAHPVRGGAQRVRWG